MPELYTISLSRRARRNLYEDLPLEVAVAATETTSTRLPSTPTASADRSTNPPTATTRPAAALTGSSTASMKPNASSRSTRSATAGTPTASDDSGAVRPATAVDEGTGDGRPIPVVRPPGCDHGEAARLSRSRLIGRGQAYARCGLNRHARAVAAARPSTATHVYRRLRRISDR